MASKKKSIGILGFIGLAIGGVLIYKASTAATPNNNNTGGNTNTGNSNSNGSNNTNTPTYPIFWLQYHPDVKLLQMALGFTGKNVDGRIGRDTAAALSKYNIQFNSTSQILSRTALDIMITAINNYDDTDVITTGGGWNWGNGGGNTNTGSGGNNTNTGNSGGNTNTGSGGNNTNTGSGGNTSNTGNGSNTGTNGYPIVWLKYHPDVKLLQTALGFSNKDTDGIIGNQTRTALAIYGLTFNSTSQIISRTILDIWIDTINNYYDDSDDTLMFAGGGGCLMNSDNYRVATPICFS